MTAMVGIVLGSDSDLPMMKDAVKVLEKFGITYEMNISSAHRPRIRLPIMQGLPSPGG
ncbi:hypothetical protein N752_07590 [Desulforamulus aquiferis]|nr:hypothetical protein N752_07590 [Desulforamulus aquiferis]